MKNIDITETISEGTIDTIILCLTQLKSVGYDKIYWDGYDSYIEAYQSHQPERLNPEAPKGDAIV